jgi:hypothetical protein
MTRTSVSQRSIGGPGTHIAPLTPKRKNSTQGKRLPAALLRKRLCLDKYIRPSTLKSGLVPELTKLQLRPRELHTRSSSSSSSSARQFRKQQHHHSAHSSTRAPTEQTPTAATDQSTATTTPQPQQRHQSHSLFPNKYVSQLTLLGGPGTHAAPFFDQRGLCRGK